MMQKLLIFPYNGNGLEALDCIGDQYQFIGFIDDMLEKQGIKDEGYTVFNRTILDTHPDAKILAVPGSPASFQEREKNIGSLHISEDRFITLIHPSANIGKHVKLGLNCLIMAGVVITSNASIGDHVCVLPNTVIHHDTVIEDYTLIGSSVVIAGGTHIGMNCYIGSGTTIINGVKIGDQVLIGLGSNVINNIPTLSKSVGNPARQIKTS